MARKQLGTNPTGPSHAATKGYTDNEISEMTLTSSQVVDGLGYTPESPSNKGIANGYASLDGGGKIPVSQLPSSIMEYQGTYNASTNTPSLSNGSGDTGDVYRVSVAGTRNFGTGNITFEVGDYAIYNGSTWEKSDTTDAVSTVAGLSGDISASGLRGALGTGTPSNTTWLRGDGAWETLPASGITRSIQTINTSTTLGSAANTDYTIISNVDGGGDPYWRAVSTLLRFDNNTTDSSIFGMSWSGAGGSFSSATKLFGTHSIQNPVVVGPGNAAWGLGLVDFTIEMWIYTSSTGFTILDWRDGGTTNMPLFAVSSSKLIWYAVTSNINIVTGATNIPSNTWFHVAVTRQSGIIRLFLNGVLDGVGVDQNPNYVVGGGGRPLLGRNGPDIGGGLTGFVDEVRFTRGISRYNASFPVPTAAFPATTTVSNGPILPTAVNNTNLYTIKNNTNNAVGVGTTSSQKIDDLTSFQILPFSSIRVVSNGSNWYTV